MTDLDLGPVIRAERDRRDMTQDALAAATGIDRDKIGKIETGVRRISSTELVLIANALQMTADRLFRAGTAPASVMYRGGVPQGDEARKAEARFDQFVSDAMLTLELEQALDAHRS